MAAEYEARHGWWSIRETIHTAPQMLQSDLVEFNHLASLDSWPDIWLGPTEEWQPNEWNELLGWELAESVDSQRMVVKLNSGSHYDVFPGKLQGIDLMQHTAWESETNRIENNSSVILAAENVWLGYFEAVTSVIGAPKYRVTWSDGEFPLGICWPSRERREQTHNPQKLAVWWPRREGSVEDPVIELSLVVSDSTVPEKGRGRSAINLTLRSPRDIVARGGALR